jgi:hypothetical protein
LLTKPTPVLCDFGKQLYDHYFKNKDEFAKKIIGELVAAKTAINKCPSVGMVTGRDNMKTYTF